MSYLNPLRLHFAGKFQANVSTVNNDPGHFDNATFLPSYQQMQTGNTPSTLNGWFNPAGDAGWRLMGCNVTSAWMADGSAAPSTDPVLHLLIADAGKRVCGKLVDLDPEQQLVSEIWGLQVRIVDGNGNALLQGDFQAAAFMDIWDRATGSGGGGDVGAGAMYQSVLTRLVWGNVLSSPFLVALKASATQGKLSIKFNVDGFNLSFTSPDFMCGRIVGTIGPCLPGEPDYLVLGRQLMATAGPHGNFFTPVGGINFCVAVVDSKASAIYLDLGNALTTNAPGGPPNDLGNLTLVVTNAATSPAIAATVATLGVVASQGSTGYASDPTWYNRTAGIVVIALTAQQLATASAAPLTLQGPSGSTVKVAEAQNGRFVRADRFVYRLSPGDHVKVSIVATQWGKPLPNAAITLMADASQLQPSNSIDPNNVPPVATPAAALAFNATSKTGADGRATLSFSAMDPGNPRGFIDGQVYGVRPAFAGTQVGPINQWNFVSVLLWSSFAPTNPITWNGCIQPIFQLYANLYPIMKQFLDLSDYASVCAHAQLLSLAFGLDPANPNSMPVCRDLSPAKRAAILTWLKNPLPGAVHVTSASITAATTAVSATAAVPQRGGKAMAASRRLIVTNHANTAR